MKALSLVAALMLSFATVLFLFQPEEVSAGAPTRQPHPASTSPSTHAPAIPDEQMLFLVRSTLLSLEAANRSGNYSVLRDLASPDFQRKNSVTDLARIFADLRHRGVDLGPIAVLAPTALAAPLLDPRGFLKLRGEFPSRGQQIEYLIALQVVDHHWLLDGVSITALPPPIRR